MRLLREIPPDDRPREKLMARGPEALTDTELLAIFLRTGRRGKSALDLARELIDAKGSLIELSRCPPDQLTAGFSGIGPAKAAELSAAIELGRRLARGGDVRPLLDSADAIHAAFGPELQARNREVVKVLLLDTRLRLMRDEDVGIGSLSECIAHPREVFKAAIVHGAYGIVLLHNHPSGDPAPSRADQALTRQICDAAKLMQIQLIDHIIIGSADGGRQPYFSFRGAGLL